jgi:predicted lipoprotein with Yx(FWY)xxD motif
MRTKNRSSRLGSTRRSAVLAIGVLALAGCGGGTGYGSSSGAKTSTTPPPAAASAQVVATGKTDVGTVLVDHAGMTLYAFAADSKGHSTCTGSCAQYWPPVKAGTGAPGLPAGVSATLGTTTRADGSTQLTVNGWPMYTYAGDAKPGDAAGQGKNLSGGLWWVVDPKGDWVKDTGSTGGGRSGY